MMLLFHHHYELMFINDTLFITKLQLTIEGLRKARNKDASTLTDCNGIGLAQCTTLVAKLELICKTYPQLEDLRIAGIIRLFFLLLSKVDCMIIYKDCVISGVVANLYSLCLYMAYTP